MKDFPDFMKVGLNHIKSSQQNTKDIDGYYYTASDGSQMAFWTCREDRESAEHCHDFDEYMLCVSGECRVNRIEPGRRAVYPEGYGSERTMHRRNPHDTRFWRTENKVTFPSYEQALFKSPTNKSSGGWSACRLYEHI